MKLPETTELLGTRRRKNGRSCGRGEVLHVFVMICTGLVHYKVIYKFERTTKINREIKMSCTSVKTSPFTQLHRNHWSWVLLTTWSTFLKSVMFFRIRTCLISLSMNYWFHYFTRTRCLKTWSRVHVLRHSLNSLALWFQAVYILTRQGENGDVHSFTVLIDRGMIALQKTTMLLLFEQTTPKQYHCC